jgi:hypothetical protein
MKGCLRCERVDFFSPVRSQIFHREFQDLVTGHTSLYACQGLRVEAREKQDVLSLNPAHVFCSASYVYAEIMQKSWGLGMGQ